MREFLTQGLFFYQLPIPTRVTQLPKSSTEAPDQGIKWFLQSQKTKTVTSDPPLTVMGRIPGYLLNPD
jgi:hypothetical protein